MHPHKRRPPRIRGVKVRQALAVRVRPPRADKDGPHGRARGQVGVQGGLHGLRDALDGQVVLGRGAVDKGVHLGKGVARHDVHGLQRVWELAWW